MTTPTNTGRAGLPGTNPGEEVILGCLLGGALGDALGYPVEFIRSADEIRRRFGPEPPAELTYRGGEVGRISDDTQMTLFTAEGMVRAYERARDKGIVHGPSMIARAYVRWYRTQTEPGPPPGTSAEEEGLVQDPRLYSQRAPGNTCMSALERLSRDVDALPSVHTPPNDSKGCGAVMRVAPIGLAARSAGVAFELALESSVVTHGHPSGYLSAAYVAAVIWWLARGVSLQEAMEASDALVAPLPGNGEVVELVERARVLAARGPPSVEALESLGGGWTGEEALALALLCALTWEREHPSGVERALWRAVVHGGDSDSTGSIAGNLIGAEVGAARLPRRWLGKLELREVIERTGRELRQAAGDGES